MATTTFALVRAGFETQIEALTPGTHADILFRKALDEVDFEEWAAENPQAVFRRFSIRNDFDWQPVDVTGTDLLIMRHGCTVHVGYPSGLAAYGVDNLRDVDDLIEADVDQIDEAIGVHGYANYASGLHASELTRVQVTEVGQSRIVSITFDLQYYRNR